MRLITSIFVSFVVLSASQTVSAQEKIAETGAILSSEQIREAVVGHSFEDDSSTGDSWEETYHSNGSLESRSGMSRTTGSYTIEENSLCVQYNEPSWDSFEGCWKVKLRREDGSRITYIMNGSAVDGKRSD